MFIIKTKKTCKPLRNEPWAPGCRESEAKHSNLDSHSGTVTPQHLYKTSGHYEHQKITKTDLLYKH